LLGALVGVDGDGAFGIGHPDELVLAVVKISGSVPAGVEFLGEVPGRIVGVGLDGPVGTNGGRLPGETVITEFGPLTPWPDA